MSISPEVFVIAVGDLLTLLTLIVLIVEVRHLKKSIHSATYQHVYEQMINIDKFFIEHPSLKPYFYGEEEIKTQVPDELNRLLSVAEMLTDYLDCVYHQRDCMPEGTFSKFLEYMRYLFNTSRPLKRFIAERGRDWYPDDFIEDIKKPPKVQN